MSVASNVSANVANSVASSTSQISMQGRPVTIIVQNIISEANNELITEAGTQIIKE